MRQRWLPLASMPLQHRGQEAAGITCRDGTEFYSHRALGPVAGNFDSQDVIERLKGDSACGHVRYSTTGAGTLAQHPAA